MSEVMNMMQEFYSDGKEICRLSRGIGPLELARTKEILPRYLPSPPATVYDIGGAHGVYSFWLAEIGYHVHLVDVVPVHIEEAKRTEGPKLAGMEVCDARSLSFADASSDVVILHGPLYHLTEAEDRMAVLREAYRVLRPGGLLLAFGISSYASTIVGIVMGRIRNPDYYEMCETEVTTGLHQRPESWPTLFTDGFFHHPSALKAEVEDAGFACEEILGVEGPGWIVPDFVASWEDAVYREDILRIARMLEKEPVLSPHIMAVGWKVN